MLHLRSLLCSAISIHRQSNKMKTGKFQRIRCENLGFATVLKTIIALLFWKHFPFNLPSPRHCGKLYVFMRSQVWVTQHVGQA